MAIDGLVNGYKARQGLRWSAPSSWTAIVLKRIWYVFADTEAEDGGSDLLSEQKGDADGESPNPKVPHRWRVIFMMALAFVLCNMDKVCTSLAAQRKPSVLFTFFSSGELL
jgi:hypothetical protein